MSRSKSIKGEEELHSAVRNLVTKLCTSDEFITQLTSSITESIGEKFNKEVQLLKEENNTIKETLCRQEKMIKSLLDIQERHDEILRSRHLRWYGVKEEDNEKCTQVILEILKAKMNISVDVTSIEMCYRIGKSVGNKNRPILVRFCTNAQKNLIFNKKRLLKNTGITIREDLTNKQLELFKASLNRVGKNGRVWSNFGKIFVNFNDNDSIVKIIKLEDLEKF